MSAPKLNTPADLAAAFGDDVSVRQVMDWCRDNDWPRVKVGRVVRFTDEQVALILSRHTVGGSGRNTGAAAPTIAGQTKRSAAARKAS